MDLDDATVCAASLAPVIDRLRLGIMERVRPLILGDPVFAGIGPDAGRTLAMLRNRDPEAPVAVAGVEALFPYLPPAAVAAGIDQLVTGGLLEQPEPDRLRFTDLGREAVGRQREHGTTAAVELWGDGPLVGAMADLTGRAVDAARATGGPAFSVVDSGQIDQGDLVAPRLAEQLTALRFHRADAHVAAWRAAGLTAEQVSALGAGARRDAIELATNRSAATAYEPLAIVERLELLAGLAALRN